MPGGIYVVAGPNGGGKSSIIGDALQNITGAYFNPDDATQRLVLDRGLEMAEANSRAWRTMVALLDRAIAQRGTFVFESTLGGQTITSKLLRACSLGVDVSIWYIALGDASQHIARVHDRVERGGHDIPEDKIRERYDASRRHLIELMPFVKELWVYDNSDPLDGSGSGLPRPRLILHMRDGRLINSCELHVVPEWAKAVVMRALQLDQRPSG